MNIKATFVLSLLMLPALVQAKTFKNNYITFEVPDTWGCEQEANEYICTPLDGVNARDAMIVISAKEAGPEDSFAAYQAYLAKPRILNSDQKIPEPSKVIAVRAREINSQRWIEGLHLGSEIPKFYSLYLATVKQGLAVLVSISAEKEKSKIFSPDFAKLVQSIRLTASNELLSAIAARKELNSQAPIGFPANLDSMDDAQLEEQTPRRISREMMWGLVAALALVVIYFGITTFRPKKKER